MDRLGLPQQQREGGVGECFTEIFVCVCVCVSERDRQTDRQTDRDRERSDLCVCVFPSRLECI